MNKKRLWLALLLAVSFLLNAFMLSSCGKATVDYMNDDLSYYIELSPEIYKSYPVDIPLVTVDDESVAREVRKLLVENKSKDAQYKGANITSKKLTLGDVANVWYRGYFVGEDGSEEDIPYASNFTDDSAHQLELGSGAFIAGIEEALIGVVPDRLASFEKKTKGTVFGTDIIYISYEIYKADGTMAVVSTERIDLRDTDVDARYGTGFKRAIIGAEIGKLVDKDIVLRIPGDELDTMYYNVTVDFAVRIDGEPLTVDTVFPADYSEATLRGKEVRFELFASSAVLYDTPEWTDEFITETLKLSTEELAEYEGASLTEKYEAKIKAELTEKAEQTNDGLIEEAMWAYYHEHVTVKHLPEDSVSAVYNEYYNELMAQYGVYSSYYDSLDAFAETYFGLSEGADWRAYITERAEGVVTEKLIFYYIIRTENLFPSDEEYERIYNENIDEYMVYYEGIYEEELNACKTEEERAAKLAEIKQNMIDYYGESYFEENVYYQYALDKLLAFADIK